MTTERTERISGELRKKKSTMDNVFDEENSDWNGFWGYNPSPDESHQFGECMEDWHDYEWRKEQEEMDRRRKEEEWQRLGETLEDNLSEDVVL